MKYCQKAISYMKKHLFVELVAVGVLFFTVTVVLMLGFLRNEYLKHLLDETSKTEETIMDISVANLNAAFQKAVVNGAEIAIDSRLYSQVLTAIKANETKTREVQSLKYSLNSRTHYNNEIAAIAIVTENGLLCEYGRYWSQSGFGKLWQGEENLRILQELYQDTMESAAGAKAGKYRISTVPACHDNFSDMILFHIAYPLVGKDANTKDCIAVAVISYQLSDIVSITSMRDEESKDIVQYLTDEDGNVVYYKDKSYLGQKEKLPKHNASTELCQELDYFGWSVHTGVDNQAMEKEVWKMFIKGIVVYLILTSIVIILWQLAMGELLKPIKIIGMAMENVKEGDLQQKIAIHGEHELWKLGKEYNHMVEALLQQRKEAEDAFAEKMIIMERCNDAERSALEAQINAHFLFNTLGAINYTAMENDDSETAELLKILSNILYYSYSRKLKNVTLGDELKWVEQYLYLQKYRLMDVFDYEISFPEEYEEWPCCKLFLQPFVENSILHGFDGWEEGGRIRITGTEDQGRLCIRIQDNGCGMKPEILDEIRKRINVNELVEEEEERSRIGIGIQNCVARLRMYYGPDMEVSVESTEGAGTCFLLLLPIPETFLAESGAEEELL